MHYHFRWHRPLAPHPCCPIHTQQRARKSSRRAALHFCTLTVSFRQQLQDMLTYPRHLLPIFPPPEDESRVGRDGSKVGGARRDLVETVTHGPHGDIGGIYTTFPWPSPEMIRPERRVPIALAARLLRSGRRKSVTWTGMAPRLARSPSRASRRFAPPMRHNSWA